MPRFYRAVVPRAGLHYKWLALSNTTLGVFLAFANSSIVRIAMPAIFQGIHVDPLAPAETNYFLWLFLGYLVVTASLLVRCGRISDLYGRVKLYNLGFAVFTLGSVLLTCTPGTGNAAALQLILYRILQGLGASFLFAITYGIQPYGKQPMGWTNPYVLGGLTLGAVLLVVFVLVDRRVSCPMFQLDLFRIRVFAAGNVSKFLAALARGGLQFMLIIWLQGIWLPLHGYRFEDTPLWAAIYMTPTLGGLAVAGPLCGWLSDRIGSRVLATGGMLVNVAGFLGLTTLPADFAYLPFACWLVVLGVGQGTFAAPNTTAIMNSLPAEHRGAGSGMRATFQNAATMLSIGVFFSIVIAALAAHLPTALVHGLEQQGLSPAAAEMVAAVPLTAALFAAFLGYNPMASLLPPDVLHHLSAHARHELLGHTFFPHLLAGPFMTGLRWAFYVSAGMCGVAALTSLLRGRH